MEFKYLRKLGVESAWSTMLLSLATRRCYASRVDVYFLLT